MATFTKTPMDGYQRFNKTVTARAESAHDAAFDSTFERSVDFGKNATLRITLRVFFGQIRPWQATAAMMSAAAKVMGLPVTSGVSVGAYPDAKGRSHLIKDWSGTDWAKFITEVKRQAMLWDRQFWLVPPDDFVHFDIIDDARISGHRATAIRPNVQCELNFEVAMAQGYAHRSIDVANLLGPGAFTSHETLYDSEDVSPVQHSGPDWNGVMVNAQQPAIAHEVGHALGLPHIGVSRQRGQCDLAVVLSQNFHRESIPALYKDGTNSSACYGTRSNAGDINNIMGMGSAFGVENARPWLDRLPLHLNLPASEFFRVVAGLGRWKVEFSEPSPKSIPVRLQ